MNKTISLFVDVAVQAAGATPLPYLQPAFATFQTILRSVEQLRSNRHQVRAITQAAGQILLALNVQDQADVDTTAREELERVLSRIEAFCLRLKQKRFVRAFLESARDQGEIQVLQTQLNLCVDAFQIGSQVSMMENARQIEDARQEDQSESNAALRLMLEKQDALLDLIGDVPITGADPDEPQGVESQQTIFRLLEGILESLKTADLGAGSAREQDFQEALARLRDRSSPAPLDPNPILAQLLPGLTPDVLVNPLKWRMKDLSWIDILTIHLGSDMFRKFGFDDGGSQNFINYLMSCDDRPLQYAALEVFLRDKNLKHFFKQDFSFTPSDNPNPVLANLKPGLTPAVLFIPLRYEIQKYAWKDILTQQLYREQISSFFQSGPEGCQRFIDYLAEGDSDVALQYAALEVFRNDKWVGHYFIQEQASSE